jgi:3-oxoacyl-[acyl-carrier protein] reductase
MANTSLDAPSQLEGQVAIVTGGGSGIGRATCSALVGEGACLVVVDVDQVRVGETLHEIHRQTGLPEASERVMGLTLDVRQEQDMGEMVRQTVDHFGQIDILITSAGILRAKGSGPKLVADMPTADWDEVLDTNLKGAFLSNHAVLPTMIRQRRGQIVNISSTSGRQGRAYDSAYCASKFGIIGLSEALAQEVLQYNIRVQVILPDAVDTPLWYQNGPIPRPTGALPVSRVASLITYLLKLPMDCLLVNPVIAPFRTRRRRAQPGDGTTEQHEGSYASGAIEK